MDLQIPPIGTRVEVLSRYSLDWMNQYRRPTVGIVAHSNPWDKPDTFRLVSVEGPFSHIYDCTISLDRVEYIKILGTSMDPNNPDAVNTPNAKSSKTFEIKGSKGDIYIVTLDGEKSTCTCPAGSHGRVCKHIKAAQEERAAG